MKTNPAAAAVLVVALGLGAGAPSAWAPVDYLLILDGIEGEPAGRAQILTPPSSAALLAQARAGTPGRLELQVGPGPLREALRRASEAGSRFRLSTEVRDQETETYYIVKLENVQVTSYTLGAVDSARVWLTIGRFEVTPRQGTRPAPATGSLQAPGGPPVLPSKRPGAGHPDQGIVADPLPDLEIRAVVPAPGDPDALTATVRNRGLGPAGATQLKLSVPVPGGKMLTAQAPVPALAAGQSAPVKIGVGDQPILEAKLRVDEPNVVGEADELNNEFHYTAKK
jgi:hypothetical protein